MCVVYGIEIDKILVHPTGVHQIDWIKKSSDLILNDMKTFQMKWNGMICFNNGLQIKIDDSWYFHSKNRLLLLLLLS